MRAVRQSCKRAILALLAGALLAACNNTGPRTVFALEHGVSVSGPTRVDEINDAGLPGLFNLSPEQVRLRSVQVVSPPRSMHVLNVRAYNIKHVGYGGIIGQQGDLPSECPGQFVPHPIGSFVVAPRKRSAYFVVLAFIFSKPGRYHLKRLKIYYTADGKDGWQYQNFDRTYVVSNPPLPGPRPL